jgi:hypothetical protein
MTCDLTCWRVGHELTLSQGSVVLRIPEQKRSPLLRLLGYGFLAQLSHRVLFVLLVLLAIILVFIFVFVFIFAIGYFFAKFLEAFLSIISILSTRYVDGHQ